MLCPPTLCIHRTQRKRTNPQENSLTCLLPSNDTDHSQNSEGEWPLCPGSARSWIVSGKPETQVLRTSLKQIKHGCVRYVWMCYFGVCLVRVTSHIHGEVSIVTPKHKYTCCAHFFFLSNETSVASENVYPLVIWINYRTDIDSFKFKQTVCFLGQVYKFRWMSFCQMLKIALCPFWKLKYTKDVRLCPTLQTVQTLHGLAKFGAPLCRVFTLNLEFSCESKSSLRPV